MLNSCESGELSRTEVLERLGMKDFARFAQLSAEEAIRLILKKEKDAEQARSRTPRCKSGQKCWRTN